MDISRREFLKGVGVSALKLLVPPPELLEPFPSINHEGIDPDIANRVNVVLGEDFKWTSAGRITDASTLLESMKRWDPGVADDVDRQIEIITEQERKAKKNERRDIVIENGVNNPVACAEAVAAYNLAAAVKDGAVIEKFTLSNPNANPNDDTLRPVFCAVAANFGKPGLVEEGKAVFVMAEVWLVPAQYRMVTAEYTSDLPAGSQDVLLVNNKDDGSEHDEYKTVLMVVQMENDRGIITRFIPVAETKKQGSNCMVFREPLVKVFSRKSD
jgi:hypothetical protein